jgi:hypothetical protein
MPQIKSNQATETRTGEANWESVYKLGGAAALGAVLVGLAEIVITFLPGGGMSEVAETVLDWFALFQENWFLGLRNLGLLNIVLTALGILVYLALYGAYRRVGQEAYAILATIVYIIGVGVFMATNRAFPMLSLSDQYATATSEAQRTIIVAAAQSMLSVGQSHTPGTFLGFLFTEISGIIISIVMLRSQVFSNPTAYAGIMGFGCLLVFEICASFAPRLADVTMFLAMVGGLLSMAWYVLIALRLFGLGRVE